MIQERTEMLPSSTRLFAGLSILLAALAAAGGADGSDADGGSRSDARTISGTISAIIWPEARLTVEATSGPVTLTFDRNTAVFLENRLGSAADLAVGTPVRASFGGDKRAVWLEVRAATASTARLDGGPADAGGPGPATGQGPPVLPPPAADSGAPDAGPGDGGPARSSADAGAPAPPSGNVPAGPAPPEPNPGVTPPRPPRPGPSGPGPLPGGSER
jgi:hypothetical protein